MDCRTLGSRFIHTDPESVNLFSAFLIQFIIQFVYFRFNSTFMILDSTTIKKGENTFISLIHQIETFVCVWYMIRAERKSPGVIPFSSTIYRMKIWNDSLILYWVYDASADRKFITWNFWWRQTILILSFSLFFHNNNNFDQSELFVVLKN